MPRVSRRERTCVCTMKCVSSIVLLKSRTEIIAIRLILFWSDALESRLVELHPTKPSPWSTLLRDETLQGGSIREIRLGRMQRMG